MNLSMKRLLETAALCFILHIGTVVAADSGTAARVDALMKSMTLDEKIGQMTQVDYDAIKLDPTDIEKYGLGSILWGGNSEPNSITPLGWAEVCDAYQKLAMRTKSKVPLIFGIDAVHGHNNVDGAVIFPHNVGLGATRNPDIVGQIGHATAVEMQGTGIQWDFAPCVAVARNERWGRTYESFGEDPTLVKELGAAFVKGMQGHALSDKTSALACIKHYVGDGGTTNGKDQGNTEVDEATLRAIHLPGYVECIKAGALSVMASYNSWNGKKMHGNKYLLTDILKRELGFKGFVVSDWAAIDPLDSSSYKNAILQSITAGVDMAMIPNAPKQKNNYIDFITSMKELVAEGRIPMSRIDDAVRRIVMVKFEMGLFEHPFRDPALLADVGSKEHRAIGRDAVRQSLVVLKNEKSVLPLSKACKRIIVAGKGADDIGMQCGGWTINWQGKSGAVLSGGTTILQSIKRTVSKNTTVDYRADGSGAIGADVAIVVVGEEPYAEMLGDRNDLHLSSTDIGLIERVASAGIPVVVILLSGRPMIITDVIGNAQAFVAAWLPGTEGQGVADVLFGDYKPTGKLPHTWPKDMTQIPVSATDTNIKPLFPYGFGLTYEHPRQQ